MGWIGLHTSPSHTPHATICYWREADDIGLAQITNAVIVFADERVRMGWKGTLPFIVNGLDTYGAKTDPVEVAKIEPAWGYRPAIEDLLDRFKPFHQSEWPVSMDTLHVTKHRDRVFFEFKWIGMHTRTHVEYWRLTP